MVTWANDHYFDFVMNWVTNLRRINVTNFMVGAMDDDLLQRLLAEDVPTWAMQSGLTTNDFGWGSPTFHKMGRSKIQLIFDFVSMVRNQGRVALALSLIAAFSQGFDVFVSDVDTVWMRDPRPFVLRYPGADLLTSCDHLANTVTVRIHTQVLQRRLPALTSRRMTGWSASIWAWAPQTSASCSYVRRRCPWWKSGMRCWTRTRRFGTRAPSTICSGGAREGSCPTAYSWPTTCVRALRVGAPL